MSMDFTSTSPALSCLRGYTPTQERNKYGMLYHRFSFEGVIYGEGQLEVRSILTTFARGNDFSSCEQSEMGTQVFGHATGCYLLETNCHSSSVAKWASVDLETGSLLVFSPFIPCCPFFHLLMFRDHHTGTGQCFYRSFVEKDGQFIRSQQAKSPDAEMAALLMKNKNTFPLRLALAQIPLPGLYETLRTSRLLPPSLTALQLVKREREKSFAALSHDDKEEETLYSAALEWRSGQGETAKFRSSNSVRLLEVELINSAQQSLTNAAPASMETDEQQVGMNGVALFRISLLKTYRQFRETEESAQLAELKANFLDSISALDKEDISAVVNLLKTFVASQTNLNLMKTSNERLDELEGVHRMGKPRAAVLLTEMASQLETLNSIIDNFPAQMQNTLSSLQSSGLTTTGRTFANNTRAASARRALYTYVDETRVESLMKDHASMKTIEFSLSILTQQCYNQWIGTGVAKFREVMHRSITDLQLDTSIRQFIIIVNKFVSTTVAGLESGQRRSHSSALLCLYRFLASLQRNIRLPDSSDFCSTSLETVRYNFDALKQESTNGKVSQQLAFLKPYFEQINKYKEKLVNVVASILKDFYAWSDLGISLNKQAPVREWRLDKIEQFIILFESPYWLAETRQDVFRERSKELLHEKEQLGIESLNSLDLLTQVFEEPITFIMNRMRTSVPSIVRNGIQPQTHLALLHQVIKEAGFDSGDINQHQQSLAKTIEKASEFHKDKLKSAANLDNSRVLFQGSGRDLLLRRYLDLADKPAFKLYWTMREMRNEFWDKVKKLFQLTSDLAETALSWRHHSISSTSGSNSTIVSDRSNLMTARWWTSADDSDELSSQEVLFNFVKSVNDREYFDEMIQYIDPKETQRQLLLRDFEPRRSEGIVEYNSNSFPESLLPLCKWWDSEIFKESFVVLVNTRLHEAEDTLRANNEYCLGVLRKSNLALHEIFKAVLDRLCQIDKDDVPDANRRIKWWNWLQYCQTTPYRKEEVETKHLASRILALFRFKNAFASAERQLTVQDNELAKKKNLKTATLFCQLMEDRAYGQTEGNKTKTPIFYINREAGSDPGVASAEGVDRVESTTSVPGANIPICFISLIQTLGSRISSAVQSQRDLSSNTLQQTQTDAQLSFFHGIWEELSKRVEGLISLSHRRMTQLQNRSGERGIQPPILTLKLTTESGDNAEPSERTDVELRPVSQRLDGQDDEYSLSFKLMNIPFPQANQFAEELLARVLSKPPHETKRRSRTALACVKKIMRTEFRPVPTSLAKGVPLKGGPSPTKLLLAFLIDALLAEQINPLSVAALLSSQEEDGIPYILRTFNAKLGRRTANEAFPREMEEMVTANEAEGVITGYEPARSLYAECAFDTLENYIPGMLQGISDVRAKFQVESRVYVDVCLFVNALVQTQQPFTETGMSVLEENLPQNQPPRMLEYNKETLIEAMELGHTVEAREEAVGKLLRDKLHLFMNRNADSDVVEIELLSQMMEPSFWARNYVEEILKLRRELNMNANKVLYTLRTPTQEITPEVELSVPSVAQKKELLSKSTLAYSVHSNDQLELIDLTVPIFAAVDMYTGDENRFPSRGPNQEPREWFVESIQVTSPPRVHRPMHSTPISPSQPALRPKEPPEAHAKEPPNGQYTDRFSVKEKSPSLGTEEDNINWQQSMNESMVAWYQSNPFLIEPEVKGAMADAKSLRSTLTKEIELMKSSLHETTSTFHILSTTAPDEPDRGSQLLADSARLNPRRIFSMHPRSGTPVVTSPRECISHELESEIEKMMHYDMRDLAFITSEEYREPYSGEDELTQMLDKLTLEVKEEMENENEKKDTSSPLSDFPDTESEFESEMEQGSAEEKEKKKIPSAFPSIPPHTTINLSEIEEKKSEIETGLEIGDEEAAEFENYEETSAANAIEDTSTNDAYDVEEPIDVKVEIHVNDFHYLTELLYDQSVM